MLAGIFDEHGGAVHAQYANTQFPKYFNEEIKKSDNIHQIFQSVISQIQTEVSRLKNGIAMVQQLSFQ